MATFSPAQAVKYTADSVKELRAIDLDRLFSQNCETRTHQDKVAAYLAKHRPDLQQAIDDCLSDPEIREPYTAPEVAAFLKTKGIAAPVKRQVYADDGSIVVVKTDGIVDMEQIRVLHSILSEISTRIDSAWVALRRHGGIMAIYPGKRPAPATSDLTAGVKNDWEL